MVHSMFFTVVQIAQLLHLLVEHTVWISLFCLVLFCFGSFLPNHNVVAINLGRIVPARGPTDFGWDAVSTIPPDIEY